MFRLTSPSQRPGGHQVAGGRGGRGPGDARGPLRALPYSRGLPPAHPPRPGRHPARLPAPGVYAPSRHHRDALLKSTGKIAAMRRAALIYNPRSGRQRHARVLDAILSTLRAGGFDIEPTPTEGAGHATELGREKGREVEVVFAFGGDGTMREVAAGLLGSPAALGVIPGGTANLLGLALGLPRDPVAAAAVLPALPVRPFDVGLAVGVPYLMMHS